jgi:porin
LKIYKSKYRLNEILLCAVICIAIPDSLFAQDSTIYNNIVPYDSIKVGEHKSGYQDLVTIGGSKSVNADLVSDDEYKSAWLDTDLAKEVFTGYYKFKRHLKDEYNLAIGMDYMFLNQYASFSYSDRQAASGIFRIFGTWVAFNIPNDMQGSLIIKVENRHLIGSGTPPRQLGYDAGSALSTASFKVFNWGITNFYWKQLFFGEQIGIVIGQMDPGDWVDLFPLLDSFRYYLNEAYFNSPAMALPNQGLGVAVQGFITDQFYLKAGLHDANGEPNKLGGYNFNSFFKTREYFTWIEAGWSPQFKPSTPQSIHLTYWHQDAREDAGKTESWGWCFSASTIIDANWYPFIRIDMSNGNAALMRKLVMLGTAINVSGHDYFGVGFNWGGPVDESKRDQYGIELFYSFQITQHLNVTPDIQLTINPSFNNEKDIVGVYSVLRIRYAM